MLVTPEPSTRGRMYWRPLRQSAHLLRDRDPWLSGGYIVCLLRFLLGFYYKLYCTMLHGFQNWQLCQAVTDGSDKKGTSNVPICHRRKQCFGIVDRLSIL